MLLSLFVIISDRMLALFQEKYIVPGENNYSGKIKPTNIEETVSHQVSVTTGPIFLFSET